MKKLIYSALGAMSLLCSCSNDHADMAVYQDSNEQCFKSHKVSIEEAMYLASSFKNGSKVLSRSDADTSNIENVVVIRWEDIYPDTPNPVIYSDDETHIIPSEFEPEDCKYAVITEL